MQTLNDIKVLLQGKKTYLIAFATIATTLATWASGELGDMQAVELIINAVLASTIRHSIATK